MAKKKPTPISTIAKQCAEEAVRQLVPVVVPVLVTKAGRGIRRLVESAMQEGPPQANPLDSLAA